MTTLPVVANHHRQRVARPPPRHRSRQGHLQLQQRQGNPRQRLNVPHHQRPQLPPPLLPHNVQLLVQQQQRSDLRQPQQRSDLRRRRRQQQRSDQQRQQQQSNRQQLSLRLRRR